METCNDSYGLPALTPHDAVAPSPRAGIKPGKKPGLIWDGAISGANHPCVIEEKVRLPTFESVQRFMSLSGPDVQWGVLSFDAGGADKLVTVSPAEQGLSCFEFQGRWFAHRFCYFGCRWAAYWFSRVGAFLVRYCHLQLLLEKGSASDMNRYYTCYVTWLSAPQLKLDVLLTALTWSTPPCCLLPFNSTELKW